MHAIFFKLRIVVVPVELPKHRQELVDMVIENLSKGHIPWHRGWSNEDYPQNAITGKPYRGVNHLLLSMLPFSDNRYCTFIQAKEKGWKIRKGAKGIQIELYKHIDLRTNKDVDWEKIKGETAKMSASEKQEFYKKNIRTLLKTYVVLLHATKEGDIVLDPFIGSGTTAVACLDINRRFVGMEISEQWHKVAYDRLNNIDARGQISLIAR